MMMIHVIIIIIIDYDHGDSDFEGYVWRRKRHCRHPLTELQVDQRMKMMILQDMLGWEEGIAATLSWNPKQAMGGGGRGIKSMLLEKRPFIFLCFKHTNSHISH